MVSKKRIILICVAIAIIVILLLTRCSRRVFNNNDFKSDIVSIEIKSGSTGERITVTDEDKVDKIISNFANLKMRFKSIFNNYVGWSYNLKFRDSNGNTIYDVTVIADTYLNYKDIRYTVTGDELVDMDYLDGLFE